MKIGKIPESVLKRSVFKQIRTKRPEVLVGAGVAATGGQFGATLAYTHAPAREVSVYDYSIVLFDALLGYLLFDQVPDHWSVIGYVLIIGAAVMVFLYNNDYPPFRHHAEGVEQMEELHE